MGGWVIISHSIDRTCLAILCSEVISLPLCAFESGLREIIQMMYVVVI